MALAYFDTCSGIAGDMTLAALVDAGADREYIAHQVHSLGLGDVQLQFSETGRHCFRSLRLDVLHPPEHAHRHLSDILAILDRSQLAPGERNTAARLFRRLGAAEANVHGTSIEEVHFHEVGAIDSIVDIVGVSVALSNLQIDRIVASPTPTGCGTIRIAHGTVSVPAPATAELLKGIPIRGSAIEAELTTPTGAAILSTLVDQFGPLPSMQISSIGYGAGHKDLAEQANLLRVFVGTPLDDDRDDVVVLETNIDDATGEKIGFAVEQLWKTGVLDVYTTAVGMKKNRPGTLLTIVCRPEQRQRVEDSVFTYCGSLGIRRSRMSRRKMHRETLQVDTPYGRARVKIAWSRNPSGQSQHQLSPEYEDCRRFAVAHDIALDAAFRVVMDAAEAVAQRLDPPADLAAGPPRDSGPSQAHDQHHDHDRGHDHDHHNHHNHHDHHDHDHDHDHHDH